MANLNTGVSDTIKQSEHGARLMEPRKKSLLIAALVVIGLIAGILIWKAIQIRNIRTEEQVKREQLRWGATQAVMQSHREHLRLLAKPYVWAIRQEMMSGNTNQLNLYANEMIKERNFRNIVIANEKGVILSSTNKRFEGKDFAAVGKNSYLSSDSTIVENINDSVIVMSSPVMGFNSRLGTLMITYAVPAPAFNDSTYAAQ